MTEGSPVSSWDKAVLSGVNHGQSGRELMYAVFAGDAATVARMLRVDPVLRTTAADDTDLLTIAIARGDRATVDALLWAKVSPDGMPGTLNPPLACALRASEPWFAEQLLIAGASPAPLCRGGYDPLADAIALASGGAVRLLLDHGADVNRRNALGHSSLLNAIDMQLFAVAELLIARGADIWAVDATGGTLGWGLSRPAIFTNPDDDAAQARLLTRLGNASWPFPPPNPQEVRRLVLAGKWPPDGHRGRHVAIPAEAIETMRREELHRSRN